MNDNNLDAFIELAEEIRENELHALTEDLECVAICETEKDMIANLRSAAKQARKLADSIEAGLKELGIV